MLLTRYHRASFYACVVLAMGCSTAPPTADLQAAQVPAYAEQGDTGVVVDVQFEISATEKYRLRGLLAQVARRGDGPDVSGKGYVARLYRFPARALGEQERYLLFGYRSPDLEPSGSYGGLKFYVVVITNDSVALSEPYGLADATLSWVDEIRDVDSDGLSDIVYCERYEDDVELPKRKVITYDGSSWLILELPSAYADGCKV